MVWTMLFMSHRLLILNPGSTSTKAAVYDGEHQTAMKSIVHTNQDLAPYPRVSAYLWEVARALSTWQKLVRMTSLKPVTRASGTISSLVTAS